MDISSQRWPNLTWGHRVMKIADHNGVDQGSFQKTAEPDWAGQALIRIYLKRLVKGEKLISSWSNHTWWILNPKPLKTQNRGQEVPFIIHWLYKTFQETGNCCSLYRTKINLLKIKIKNCNYFESFRFSRVTLS